MKSEKPKFHLRNYSVTNTFHLYETGMQGMNCLGTLIELPNNLGWLIKATEAWFPDFVEGSLQLGYDTLVDLWLNGEREARLRDGSLRKS